MLVDQLISPDVPILSQADTGERALALMEEHHLDQLPVIADDKYIALVQENELLDWDSPESTLDNAHFLQYRPAIQGLAHPFEAMKILYQQGLDILPVIDNDSVYLGAITKDTLLRYITERSGIDNPGGIVVLEIDPRNYSLYEIARICESEEVLLISTQIYSNKLTGKMEVTLKTNRNSLGGVVGAFERHNYKVKEVFGDNTDNDNMQDRFDNLMNYMNM